MSEKHEKINGVITYHKRTKSGMAVFYPKHDVTIKKDEKIILHTVPSRQDISKNYEKCPIVSYTVCDATVRTEDAVADAIAARISDQEFSSSDKKIIKMTVDALQKIDEMNLEILDLK